MDLKNESSTVKQLRIILVALLCLVVFMLVEI